LASARFELDAWLRAVRRGLGAGPLRALGRPARHLLIAPQDIRTSDPSIAVDIYAGLFTLGGRVVHADGTSVFEIAAPSWLWAAELHGFSWLRHLRLARSALSRANARSLLQQWRDRPDRRHRTIADEPTTAARRLISFLAQSPLLLEEADAEFYQRFMRLLAREVRKLLRVLAGARPGERLPVLVALAYYAVCTEQTAATTARLDAALSAELNARILPDGGHASRNPQAVLDLLLDLLPLKQGYIARRAAPPAALIGAIDRMMPMLRMMRHGNGALALFNGVGVTSPDLVAAALAYDDTRSQPIENAPHAGYQRLGGEGALVLMDCGQPPTDIGPLHPHAGTLAFEFSDGPQRIVINCGAPAADREALQRAARSTAAHSTLTVADHSSSSFLERRDPFGRLIAGIARGPRAVPTRREQAGDGTVTVLASHDGYAAAFGLVHERRIAVAPGLVAGTDKLVPVRSGKRRDRPYALRFHIHPAVTVTRQKDGRLLLLAAHGRAWIFEAAGGAALEIEESAFFASISGTRRCQQIVVTGTSAANPDISWRFVRAAMDPAPGAVQIPVEEDGGAK
jgi:uncharacterized heparinase superfamily protein